MDGDEICSRNAVAVEKDAELALRFENRPVPYLSSTKAVVLLPDLDGGRILEYLRQGVHVVLEFGRHNSLDAYLLVANILTRRIHERYREQVDRAMGDPTKMPPQLVITIEEAHKFLSPSAAHHTSFGTIAREMRKFNVTLLVVDQRPSGIDAEVLSQIGTRFSSHRSTPP